MPLVKCPTCGKKAEFSGNEYRPFCSERCKLLDFGAWADEKFTVPVENQEFTEEDLNELEKMNSEKDL